MTDIYGILDYLSEIVYISDPETYEILYMNKTGTDIFGDCIGKTCHEAIWRNSDTCGACGKDTSEKEFAEWQMNEPKDGRTYNVRSKIITAKDRKVRLSVIIDVTDSAKAQNDLEMRLAMEHFIVSCIIEMHKNRPIEETLGTVLAMTGKFLEADRVYIFDCDSLHMSNTYEWCADCVEPLIKSMQNVDIHLIDRWRQYFARGECVMIKNVEELKDSSPDEYKILADQNISSLVAAPLDWSGSMKGYVGIDNPRKYKIYRTSTFFEALSFFISSMFIRSQTEERLRRLSYLDTLTNLFNRNKFIEDCSKDPKNESVGIVYMDLNSLKAINDEQGHTFGDMAIKTLASIIISSFGDYDIYRVGGDEFVIICHGIAEEKFNERIAELRSRIDESDYNSAIGYCYSSECSDINELVKTADEQMYLDKKYFYRNRDDSGRYRFRNDTFTAFSTPELLKNLIKENRFAIWFQPRFYVNERTFSGSEALVRFYDDDGMLVSPLDSIPEMEDNKTIHIVDLYVFKHVCDYLSQWISEGREVKPVSVNMSHRTMLMPNFTENFMNIWYDYNIPKDLLIIEVTEDRERGGVAKVVDILTDLKKRGFKIAIDNFGSKYADIYLFADLKFDILKLDGDMVYKIETDKKAWILSESISQICHRENIKIVAGGVENDKELDMLKKMGCDEAQGYLFDKPLPWNEFEEKYL